MSKSIATAIVLCLLFAACKNASEPQQDGQKDTATNATATTVQLEGIDRIELFFYKDPKDLKTVQQLEVVDTAIINAFKQNVQQETIAQAECPHDVKMFLVRNGEVFKTIYGATADRCNYLAYAINSKPHYTKLDQRTKVILDSLRNVAR